MPIIGVSSPEQIKKLADTLNLPDWLVEALIVEYLPCRRFLEQDAWILFDFGSITIDDIEKLAPPYVILNNITLFHNVSPDVLRTRILHGIAGLPLATLCEAPYMSIPEGQASPSCIPFLQNDLDFGDWKLFLNGYVIVFDKDENKLYQWLSSCFLPHILFFPRRRMHKSRPNKIRTEANHSYNSRPRVGIFASYRLCADFAGLQPSSVLV